MMRHQIFELEDVPVVEGTRPIMTERTEKPNVIDRRAAEQCCLVYPTTNDLPDLVDSFLSIVGK